MRMFDHGGRRVAASLLLAVLALAGGRPLVYACPHHDGAVVSSRAGHAPAAHTGHAPRPGQPTRSDHGTSPHAALASGSVTAASVDAGGEAPSEDHGPCTCMDSCHGSSLAPMASLADADIRLAPRDTNVPGLVPATTEPAPASPSYLLPYPNGPPGSA